MLHVEDMEDRVSKRMMLAAALTAVGASAAAAQTPTPAFGTSTGAVFASTNAPSGNEVVMWSRNAQGTLRQIGTFSTGGRGEGGINDPLRAGYSLTLTSDHGFLLAANAGSGDISVFRVLQNGLALTSITPSGGGNPISIAEHGNLVYVVNAGGDYQLSGFEIEASGTLKPVKNSLATLSSPDGGVSTLAFSPGGTKLVVTERLAKTVDVFNVNADGSLSNPVFNPSQGDEPFSEAFTPSGALLVTEANFGQKTSTVSSYTVNADNTLGVITSQLPSGGLGACWIVTDGQDALVSNTASSSLGAYAVAGNGTLQPFGIVASVALTAPPAAGQPNSAFPLDLAASQDDRFVYAGLSANGQIVGYQINTNSGLSQVASVPFGQPHTGAEGLAAY